MIGTLQTIYAFAPSAIPVSSSLSLCRAYYLQVSSIRVSLVCLDAVLLEITKTKLVWARGGEFSSALLGAFCRAQGIRQTFTLPASPQQNGIAERRIGMVMDVARTSMIHAAAPHFLWPFAVKYAAHQLNLQPRVSLPETSPTLLWTGKVGDASAFRVWGSRAFVRDLSADKLSPRAVPCPWGAVTGGTEPGGTVPGGAEPGGAGSARVASRGASLRREVLSPQELREWFARRWGRAVGAGGTTTAAGSGGTCPGGAGAAGPGGTAEAAGIGPTGGSAGASGGTGAAGSAGPGAAGAPGVGAAGGVGAGGSADACPSEGAGAGAAGAGGATRAGAPAGSDGTTRPRPYFVPLLEQVLGLQPSPGPPFECPELVWSQSLSQPISPLPAPSPYTGPTGGLAERRAPASCPASPARPARTSRPRPPAAPGTHQMALRPSTAPLRVPLPSPPASSLPAFPDPESDSLRAVIADLVDFAARCLLDYTASLVAESASVCPPSVGGECALSTDALEDRQEEFHTSGMGLVLGGRRPVVLTGHADASWADDQATQRSSQGYTFSLGSGSVSWRSTRSSSVLSSSCEAEIYAGAMAAQELRWLTYLLIDLGEQPRSPPVLYVDNKAMLALCREHRMEHRTKHIALRYFLARELQQRGQLRLANVASEANTADIFTKALAPGDHQRFCTLLACFALLDWSCDLFFSPTLPMGVFLLVPNSLLVQSFLFLHSFDCFSSARTFRADGAVLRL
ncbi:unnamed protein product [Closterium sp. NIES-53]